MAEKDMDSSDKKEPRSETIKRLQGLVQQRGEDGAKLVKTWLHKDVARRAARDAAAKRESGNDSK